ncbi:MAG TPA: zf-HC2 domain-containing protein [Thermoanaerobaculia bacterium]|nr:zf-HC2 domain-containing protein [Thermoanaerobaculia bacterium]
MTERESITCKTFIESLDDFVAGEMTPEQKSAAMSHLGECRSCVAYDESYRRTISLERSLRADDPQA